MGKNIPNLHYFCVKYEITNLKEGQMAQSKAPIPENTWKCSNCGNTQVATTPPEACPVCKQKCAFLNVTCYEPDCGFTGMDKRLK
jgi:rubrerythrin